MQELMCFNAFLCQYIIHGVVCITLSFKEGGAIAPLAPPLNPPLVYKAILFTMHS